MTINRVFLYVAFVACIWQVQVEPSLTESFVQNVETQSAIRRAKTARCKNEIAKIAQLVELKSVPRLLHFCPKDDARLFGKLEGCFWHQAQMPLLATGLTDFSMENTPEHCILYCYRLSQTVAAVFDGSKCVCASHFGEPTEDKRLPLAMCNAFACPGNSSIACGGLAAALVYRTSLHDLELFNYKPYALIKAQLSPKKRLDDDFVDNATAFKEKPKAKILFLIQIAGRGVRQQRRILSMLYSSDHFYFIHVDVRFDYLYRELLPLERLVPNIRLQRNRFASIWGGATYTNILTDAVHELLENEELRHFEWDYLMNLSESDLPILPVDELATFLGHNNGSNFLDFGLFWGAGQHFQNEILQKHFYECEDHMWRVRSRIVPYGVRIIGGLNYFTVTKDFLKYAIYGSDELVRELRVFFNFTVLPLEHFLQTLLVNSAFCDTGVSSILRLNSFWSDGREHPCSQDYVDYCGGSPNIIRDSDFRAHLSKEVAAERMHFIGRKFDPFVNLAVVHMVEHQLLNLSPLETKRRMRLPGYNIYWLNDYHYLDKSPQTSYSKLLLMQSMAALALDDLSFARRTFGRQASCVFSDKRRRIQILELTIAKHFDKSVKFLLLYNVSCRQPGSKKRFAVTLESEFVRVTTQKLWGRLESVEVGTSLDNTEKVFKNYLGVISTNDVPKLRHTWKPGPRKTSATITWWDPRGNLRDKRIQVIHAGRPIMFTTYSGSPTGAYLPPLYPPGIWMVKIVDNEFQADPPGAQFEFAVFPSLAPSSTTNSGEIIIWNLTQSEKLDRKSEPNLSLPTKASRFSQMVVSNSIAQRYFKPRATCVVDNPKSQPPDATNSLNEFCPNMGNWLPECVGEEWSSRSPDPKSEFRITNPTV